MTLPERIARHASRPLLLAFALTACAEATPVPAEPAAPVVSASAPIATQAPAPPAPTATSSASAPAAPAPLPPCKAERSNRRKQQPTGLPVIRGPVDLDPSTWSTERFEGMSWRQPKGVFATKKVPGGVDLWSEVVVDSPHGQTDPGDESRHWLRAELRLREESLPEAVCNAVPYQYESLFEKGKMSAETTKIDGREAYAVPAGIHGYDETHHFIALAPRRTATISFSTISVDVFDDKAFKPRHAPISKQQQAIVEKMLASFRF